MAKKFRSMDRCMMALRSLASHCCFSGFCSGTRTLCLISFECCPVFVMVLSIAAMVMYIMPHPYFSCSALILSIQAHSSFFSNFTVFYMSCLINGVSFDVKGLSENLLLLRCSRTRFGSAQL